MPLTLYLANTRNVSHLCAFGSGKRHVLYFQAIFEIKFYGVIYRPISMKRVKVI